MTNTAASTTPPSEPRIPAVRAALRAATPAARDDEGGGTVLLAALVGVSVAVHVAIFGGLTGAARRARAHRARPPSVVAMEIAPRPSPPPVEAPRPLAGPAVRRAASRSTSRAAPPAARAAAPEAPADFSGVTLTNDGPGPGWASATGDGHAMTGPIGRPAGAPHGEGARPVVDAVAITPLASLSRPPAPPDLNAALEAHYPLKARRQGLAGRAVLRARITADGHTRDLVLLTQSADGFGEACRSVLREAVWTAPLDRDGHPVATIITYTCAFEVH